MGQAHAEAPGGAAAKHPLAHSFAHRFIHADQGNWTSGASILQATQPTTSVGNKMFAQFAGLISRKSNLPVNVH